MNVHHHLLKVMASTKFPGREAKYVDHGPDRSFRDGRPFVRPDFRMADVTTGIPGSGHKANGQKGKNQNGQNVPARRTRVH